MADLIGVIQGVRGADVTELLRELEAKEMERAREGWAEVDVRASDPQVGWGKVELCIDSTLR